MCSTVSHSKVLAERQLHKCCSGLVCQAVSSHTLRMHNASCTDYSKLCIAVLVLLPPVMAKKPCMYAAGSRFKRMLLTVLLDSSGCCYLCLSIGVAAVGKMGVHLSADSSGILRVDKAESVIEVWEEYEVDVPVETLQENVTIEAKQTLEGGSETDEEVSSSILH